MASFNQENTRITSEEGDYERVKNLLKDESLPFEQKVVLALAELLAGLQTLHQYGCELGHGYQRRLERLESWRSWIIGGCAGFAALMAFLLFLLTVAKGLG